jgi:hypothetical protein
MRKYTLWGKMQCLSFRGKAAGTCGYHCTSFGNTVLACLTRLVYASARALHCCRQDLEQDTSS